MRVVVRERALRAVAGDRIVVAGKAWVCVCVCVFCFVLFFVFPGPHSQHMEVPRLGVPSELLLPAYTTATGSELRLQPTPQLIVILDP